MPVIVMPPPCAATGMRFVNAQHEVRASSSSRLVSTLWRSRRLAPWLAFSLAAVLAGCGASSPSAPKTSPTCLADLAATGAQFTPWATSPGGQCAVDVPLMLQSAGAALQPPIKTACAMASTWASFVPVIDRIALRQTGSRIRTVLDAGSWSCRTMTGNRRRLSLHASGRAIDVTGFVLADGRTALVRRDWYRNDQAGRFLRAVGAAACKHFQVVLGPPADHYHRDNLHMDIGPWKLCQV